MSGCHGVLALVASERLLQATPKLLRALKAEVPEDVPGHSWRSKRKNMGHMGKAW